MPEISVIVPVYNTGKYLARCIDSILSQTFSDLELILVNDGSTDDSGAICDAYAARDSRVRVLHQENQGQSVARNNAIARMQGRWVHFVDSDDWIHPQMLQRLYEAAGQWNTDIAICGYAETGGEDPAVPPESFRSELWTPKDFYMQRFINATIPVGKLIRRECLGDNRFPVGKYIDDEYIIYRILFSRDRLAVMEAPMYAYFTNMASLTKRAWNPRRLDAWEAYEQQITFFDRMGDEELVRFRYRGYLENAVVNLQGAEEHPEQYATQIRFIRKRIRNVIRRAWKRGELDFRLDFELLYRFYPLLTRGYRFYLEKIK